MKDLYFDHLYSREISGTLKTISSINIQDIKNYIASYLSRDKLIIGIVGNLTAQEAGIFLDKAFQGLPATSHVIEVPNIRANKRTKIITIPKDIPQSTVLFAHHGVTFEDPELLKISVLMQILGAGDTSRLNEEIREKRGLAYSVGAGLLTMKHGGLVMGSLDRKITRLNSSP